MSEAQAAAAPDEPEGERHQQHKRRIRRIVEVADVLRGRTCFVVMPYGNKKISLSDGDVGAERLRTEMFDFDAVYDNLILPCLDGEGFEPIRSDEEADSGMIHQQMIQRIIDCDLVIVDVSSWNPNVFYELGIRHTAQRSGTIILRREGEKLPFNIAGMRAIEYPPFRTQAEWNGGGSTAEEARDRLRAAIIASLRPGLPDSPVHTLVPGLNISRPSKPLSYSVGVTCPLDSFIDRNLAPGKYSIPGGVPLRSVKDLRVGATSKRIGVIEGDLSRVDCVDAWVNPENTRFEMARPHDRSISAIIRAQASNRGRLSTRTSEDVLARKLRQRAERVGGEVEAGAAVALPPYQLRRQNNLVAIVHVAAQTGMRGRGYQTTRNLEDCIDNTLDAVAAWNSSLWRRFLLRPRIRSVLFPLFGSANPDWQPEWVAERLIGAAAQYLALWPTISPDTVFFLAYSDQDRAVIRSAFIRLGLADASLLEVSSAASPKSSGHGSTPG